VEPVIVNPTPFPDAFRFVLPEGVPALHIASAEGAAALADADAVCVLDTAEPKRIGKVANGIGDRPLYVIDHHVPSDKSLDGLLLQDPTACATGELIHDLLRLHDWPAPWPRAAREGVYSAIVTDTGSFRYANATPRAHAIAGALIAQGVDPEEMYRRIYGTVPMRRIELLRQALQTLEADPQWPVSWISVDRRTFTDLGATAEDIEGLVEYARSIEGTEVALLFREVPDGSTKISFRSNGALDVNAIAREFGGGGHVKASGAIVSDRLAAARVRVLEVVRQALANAGLDFRAASGTT
jgi:bifunctional oligoribonuclease and PAP phosphatase NrnA